MLAAAALVFTAGEASAQMGKREYINGGWQYNGSVANDFAGGLQPITKGYAFYWNSNENEIILGGDDIVPEDGWILLSNNGGLHLSLCYL